MPSTVFISAGEVSGDIVGALLTREILERDPGALVFGIGGTRMAAAGVRIDLISDQLGAVGITEAVAMLPVVPRAWWRIRRSIRRHRPDVAVLIANDVFNVCLARWLRSQGVRCVAYFPPQAWLWRSLARPIARSFDAILASFPHEYSIYQAAARTTEVRFVGHYLADELRPVTADGRAAARHTLGMGDADQVVGLLPGSRSHEILSLLPVMLDAAATLAAGRRSIRFVLPIAAPQHRSFIEQQIRERALSDAVILSDGSRRAMAASDLLLLASGTASLEAALLGVPSIIIYKVSRFTHLVIKASIRLGLIGPYEVGLPNLILGRTVVPELLQSRATAPALALEAEALLASPARRQAMRDAFAEVATTIAGHHAAARPMRTLERTADFILSSSRDRHSAAVEPLMARNLACGVKFPGRQVNLGVSSEGADSQDVSRAPRPWGKAVE